MTSHFSRLPSADKMNAPLRVPTNTRTLLMCLSSLSVQFVNAIFVRGFGKPILLQNRGSLRGLNAGAFHVDHPGNAEAVGEHAEAMRPEGFAERHGDGRAFRERAENALGFLDVVEPDIDAESLGLGIAAWRRVGGHKDSVADRDAGVENFLLPFGRH